MGKVTIYHNPRCSKSRQTLALIEAAGFEPTVVRYLDTAPDIQTLDSLCRALGREPLELMRTKEARFRELGLSAQDDRPRNAWLRLIHENPILLERPIVIKDNRVCLGRPPENVLDIL